MWIERLMAGISHQHVLSYNPFILNGISPIAKGDLKWRDALLVTGTVNSNAVFFYSSQ